MACGDGLHFEQGKTCGKGGGGGWAAADIKKKVINRLGQNLTEKGGGSPAEAASDAKKLQSGDAGRGKGTRKRRRKRER